MCSTRTSNPLEGRRTAVADKEYVYGIMAQHSYYEDEADPSIVSSMDFVVPRYGKDYRMRVYRNLADAEKALAKYMKTCEIMDPNTGVWRKIEDSDCVDEWKPTKSSPLKHVSVYVTRPAAQYSDEPVDVCVADVHIVKIELI